MRTYIVESQSSFSESEQEKRDCCKQKSMGNRRRRANVNVRFGGVTKFSSPYHLPGQIQHDRTTTSTSQQTAETETLPLWYTREEYAGFKKLLEAEAKDLLQLHRARTSSDESGVTSIRRAYTIITSSCASQGPEHMMVLDDEEIVDLLLELDLPFHGCSEIVGLEQWVSRTIRSDRSLRRRRLWEAVFDIQSQSGHGGPNASNDKRQSCEDRMRVACEDISRPASLFAQYSGIAASSHDR